MAKSSKKKKKVEELTLEEHEAQLEKEVTASKKKKKKASKVSSGSQILKKTFKSIEEKNIKISKTKKPQITQVETKFVVSTTLDNKPLDLSVEH